MQKLERWAVGLRAEPPGPVQEKPFSPKSPSIPKLSSYEGEFSRDYWSLWEFSPLTTTPSSWIDPKELEAVAAEVGYSDTDKLSKVVKWLTDGASIGAMGAGRLPAEGKNMASCVEHGYKMMDALSCWVSSKTVSGPLEKSELPPDCRVSPMSVEIKPSGRAR